MGDHTGTSSSSLKIGISPFGNGENYNIWKFRAEQALIANDYWDSITTVEPKDPKDKLIWEANRKKAKALVCLALDENQIPKVMECESVLDIFAVLEKEFSAKSAINRITLKSALFSYAITGNVRAGVDGFVRLVSDAKACGVKDLSEEDLGIMLMNALPSSYANLKQTLLINHDNLTFDKVKSAIFNNGVVMSNGNLVPVKSEPGGEAYNAMTPSGKKIKVCKECGKTGHLIDKCYNIIGFPRRGARSADWAEAEAH